MKTFFWQIKYLLDSVNLGKALAGRKIREIKKKIGKLLVIEPNKKIFYFSLISILFFPSEFSVWKSNGKSNLHPALIRRMELL